MEALRILSEAAGEGAHWMFLTGTKDEALSLSQC